MRTKYGAKFTLVSFALLFLFEVLAWALKWTLRPRWTTTLILLFSLSLGIWFSEIWMNYGRRNINNMQRAVATTLYVLLLVGLAFVTLLGLLMLPSETKAIVNGEEVLRVNGLYTEQTDYRDYGLFFIKER
ncbi:MAG: hypothetical protein IKE21_05325 [Erysipelotrichaceae bacterium]|nr:hypothetical protein [Erysipelotrichaceae bacterium]